MPTQIETKDTSRYLVKFYRLSKSQVIQENEDSIFYVTIMNYKAQPVPRYEREFRGLPEVQEAIEKFKKENKAKKE